MLLLVFMIDEEYIFCFKIIIIKNKKGLSILYYVGSNLGDISDPCCMSAPSENQSVLEIEKVVVAVLSLESSTTFHS